MISESLKPTTNNQQLCLTGLKNDGLSNDYWIWKTQIFQGDGGFPDSRMNRFHPELENGQALAEGVSWSNP